MISFYVPAFDARRVYLCGPDGFRWEIRLYQNDARALLHIDPDYIVLLDGEKELEKITSGNS